MTDPSTSPTPVTPLSFGAILSLGLKICQLDERAMDTARGPAVSVMMAVLVAAIGGALSMLLGGPTAIIASAVWSVFSLFLGAGIAHLLANAMGGDGTFEPFFKVMGVASIVKWIGFIPIVGWLAPLWYLVVMVVAIRRCYEVGTGTAILVVLIPAILIAVGTITLAAGALLGTAMMSG